LLYSIDLHWDEGKPYALLLASQPGSMPHQKRCGYHWPRRTGEVGTMDIEMWSYRVAVVQNEKQLVRVFPYKLFCCVI